MHVLFRPLILAIIAVLATWALCGCAKEVVPAATDLLPPSARLMQKPAPLAEVKAGDDLFQTGSQCFAAYSVETTKLMSLQGYVRTVRGKPRGS